MPTITHGFLQGCLSHIFTRKSSDVSPGAQSGTIQAGGSPHKTPSSAGKTLLAFLGSVSGRTCGWSPWAPAGSRPKAFSGVSCLFWVALLKGAESQGPTDDESGHLAPVPSLTCPGAPRCPTPCSGPACLQSA